MRSLSLVDIGRMSIEELKMKYNQGYGIEGCSRCGRSNSLGIRSLPAVPFTESFEYIDKTAAEAAGWTTAIATGGVATFSIASDFSNTGAKSAKIVSTSPSGVMVRWIHNLWGSSPIPVVSGTTYYASAFYKLGGGSANLTLTFWDASKVYISSVSSASISSTGGVFAKQSVNAVAPVGAAFVRPEFRLYGAGTIWIDDFSISTAPVSVIPCPTEVMSAGDVLNIASTPSGGTAPYTVVFRKGGIDLTGGAFAGVGEGMTKNVQYTILDVDSASITFEASHTDSCGKICSKICTISKVAAVCPEPSCDLVITKI